MIGCQHHIGVSELGSPRLSSVAVISDDFQGTVKVSYLNFSLVSSIYDNNLHLDLGKPLRQNDWI